MGSFFPPKKPAQGLQDGRRSVVRGGGPKKGKPSLLWFISTTGWGFLLCFGLVILLTQAAIAGQGPTDFCQDYLAAQRVIQGTPVYQPLHCWAGIVPIPTPVEYDSHPPTAVLFFYPLGFLSLVPASMIWGFFCLAAYLASGFLLLEELGWRSLRARAIFVGGSALWESVTVATLLENVWQLVTLLLVIAFVLERRGRFAWAGGVLGLASLFKIWPIVLLVSGMLQKRWKLAFSAGLTVILGIALPILLLGSEAFVTYWGPVQTNEQLWVPNRLNVSLEGVITRYLLSAPPIIPGISLAQALLCGEAVASLLLVGTLSLIWRCCQNGISEPGLLLSQSLLLTVLLLVFPISWRWSLITLLLPVGMVLLALRQLPRLPPWRLALLGVGLTPALFRLSWIESLAAWLARYNTQLALSAFALTTLGLLLFIGMQASLLWENRSKDKTSSPGGKQSGATQSTSDIEA